MRKIVMLLFVVCVAMSVGAQVYVGGTASLWRNDKDDADITTFVFAPEIGYEINDEWAIGTELGYRYDRAYMDQIRESLELHTLSFNPYVRYTYYKAGIVRLFFDGGFGITSSKYGEADRVNGFEIGLKPGVAIKLNNTFSLIGKVGFLGYRDDYPADNNFLGENTNGFGFGLSGADFKVGFQLNF